jgi:hypothetical protein
MSKKCETNSSCTPAHSMPAHKFSRKKNIYMTDVKRHFSVLQNGFSRDIYLSLLHIPEKVYFPKTTACTNIACLDVHPWFFSDLFWHIEIYLNCIFHNRWIWTFESKHHVQENIHYMMNVMKCRCSYIFYILSQKKKNKARTSKNMEANGVIKLNCLLNNIIGATTQFIG